MMNVTAPAPAPSHRWWLVHGQWQPRLCSGVQRQRRLRPREAERADYKRPGRGSVQIGRLRLQELPSRQELRRIAVLNRPLERGLHSFRFQSERSIRQSSQIGLQRECKPWPSSPLLLQHWQALLTCDQLAATSPPAPSAHFNASEQV